MNYGIYTSGLGALVESARVDVIANNLANANTVGFRRDAIAFRERLVEALEDKPDHAYLNAMVDRYGGAPFIDGVTFDPDPIAPDVTENPTDLALDGRGFFMTRSMATGENLFTRAGNFMVDRTGRLLTADGRYQVLNAAGEPVTVDPNIGRNITVTKNGEIYSGDELVNSIGVVDFNDYGRLQKAGETMFRAVGEEVESFRPAETSVMQGALEGSSVEPVVEMADMIRAFRALESNLQMIKFQDSTLEKAVNELGRVPR